MSQPAPYIQLAMERDQLRHDVKQYFDARDEMIRASVKKRNQNDMEWAGILHEKDLALKEAERKLRSSLITNPFEHENTM